MLKVFVIPTLLLTKIAISAPAFTAPASLEPDAVKVELKSAPNRSGNTRANIDIFPTVFDMIVTVRGFEPVHYDLVRSKLDDAKIYVAGQNEVLATAIRDGKKITFIKAPGDGYHSTLWDLPIEIGTEENAAARAERESTPMYQEIFKALGKTSALDPAGLARRIFKSPDSQVLLTKYFEAYAYAHRAALDDKTSSAFAARVVGRVEIVGRAYEWLKARGEDPALAVKVCDAFYSRIMWRRPYYLPVGSDKLVRDQLLDQSRIHTNPPPDAEQFRALDEFEFRIFTALVNQVHRYSEPSGRLMFLALREKAPLVKQESLETEVEGAREEFRRQVEAQIGKHEQAIKNLRQSLEEYNLPDELLFNWPK